MKNVQSKCENFVTNFLVVEYPKLRVVIMGNRASEFTPDIIAPIIFSECGTFALADDKLDELVAEPMGWKLVQISELYWAGVSIYYYCRVDKKGEIILAE